MANIYVGSARLDEKGAAKNGKAGDQKQTAKPDYNGEVSLQKMYNHSKGWYIIRPKSIIDASGLAKAMQSACDNINLGYDQNNRLGVITYGINSKVATECDCSSLVRACVIAACAKDPGNFTTDTEKKKLLDTKLFDDMGAYVSQTKTPVYDGDILVTKTKGHTVIVVTGSPRPVVASYYPKYTGVSLRIDDVFKTIGAPYGNVTKRKTVAAANGFNNYSGKATENLSLISLAKAGKLKR